MMHLMYSQVLIQWLTFAGVTLLVGGVVFRWAVLHPALKLLGPVSPEPENPERIDRRDLKRWIGGCLLLLTVVSVPDLLLRAQMMSGKPFIALPAVLPLVLFHSHIGMIWLTRVALLVFLGLLWFFIGERSAPRQRILWLLALLPACAGLCLITSLSGHAVSKGDLSVAVFADWLHVMAVASWVGGLVPLRFLLPRITPTVDKARRYQLEAAVIRRFSSLAVGCVAVLTLTGGYEAWLHLRTPLRLFTTAYGLTLLFKLAFVAPMLMLGALGRYYVRPALQAATGAPVSESFTKRIFTRAVSLLGGPPESDDYRLLHRGYGSPRMAVLHFRIFVALQCLLAIGVLGVTALLTQTSPPDLTGFTAPGDSPEMHDMEM